MSLLESMWRFRLGVGRQFFVKTNHNIPLFIRKKGVLFLHIPKAAGSSVSSSIYGQPVGHRYLRDYQRINPEQTNALYKFCIVRNPWDRLVSAYFYLMQGGASITRADQLFRRSVLWKYDTFEKFVKAWLSSEAAYSYFHFIPQFEYILDIERNIGADRIVRFEELSSQVSAVERDIGFSLELREGNQSYRQEYSKYYDAEMIAIVESIYARDIELFGYRY